MKNEVSTGVARQGSHTFIWSVVAALLMVGTLVMAFRNLDLERLPGVLLNANMIWIVAVAVSVPFEQLVRGWKWRQILYDLRPVGSFRLFGAVMAGYFANMLVPLGVSPLVRAWLVARLEGLSASTVLLTTAIERFVDGIVFAIIVGVLITFAALPSVDDDIRHGLMAAGAGSLVLFAGLFGALFLFKNHLTAEDTILGRGVGWLERAFGGKLAGLGSGMADGIIWPKSHWRGSGVIVASIVMKFVSTTHFLWAGLAFGVILSPSDYLFIMVFTSFALIMSRIVRIPGGSVIGSAFALKLLGVADEEALSMVLVVHTTSLLLIAGVGTLAMWKSGLTILNFRQYINRQGD